MSSMITKGHINAEVVYHVAGSLEAGGLPGYPQCLVIEINVFNSWQSSFTLYWAKIMKIRDLKLTQNVYMLERVK